MPKRTRKTSRTKGRKQEPPAEVLETTREVDVALLRIAQAEAAAEKITGAAEMRIRRIRESAAARAAEALEQAKGLRKAVEGWAKKNKRTFGPARSLALPHGRLGWRRVTRIAYKAKANDVVAALEAAGLEDALLVTKRPNKDVLATYEDETLADLGVRRRTADRFYADVTTETPPAGD